MGNCCVACYMSKFLSRMSSPQVLIETHVVMLRRYDHTKLNALAWLNRSSVSRWNAPTLEEFLDDTVSSTFARLDAYILTSVSVVGHTWVRAFRLLGPHDNLRAHPRPTQEPYRDQEVRLFESVISPSPLYGHDASLG